MYAYLPQGPALEGLFDPLVPNSPALWAVLLGRYAGQAVVDSLQVPAQCVLRTEAALTYFSAPTGQAFLDQAVMHFRKAGPVWLVWPPETPLQPPALAGTVRVERLEFYDCDPACAQLAGLRKQLPAGCTIQEINASLLERCEWRSEMEFYAGSLERFLAHGLGLCLLQGDEIIVEAYASSLGKTRAEIGAITRQAHRGQGLAAVASAYLVEVCRQRGYQAYWSCDADHLPSIRVAQKLGFQHTRAYQIYEYRSADEI